MTKPRHDPYDPNVMPHNPNVRGGLHKPETDSASLADHLKVVKLDNAFGNNAPYMKGKSEPSYRDDPAENLSGREE